jgi:Arc/MetJ-type ribon-helix-helix transcriptional regulator
MAARTGKPQSELIREGLRLLLRQKRVASFLSAGAGEGSGDSADRRWIAEELYVKVFGDRKSTS